jgi:glycosyltransferase involved in cell wall biosynthesis
MDLKDKQHILVYYSIFNTGGAERSTTKLITKFLDRGHKVDVLLISNGGEFQSVIDKRAEVKWLRSGDFGNSYSKAKDFSKFIYLILYALTRLEQLIKTLFYRFKKYDIVIIGLHGLSPEFCLKHIKANKYIQLIRSDLKLCDAEGKASNNVQNFGNQIDHYICVSQTALDSFKSLFPQQKFKAVKIYNLLEAHVILEKAEQLEDTFALDRFSGTSILTVCRIQEKSKAVFRMADVCEELLSRGHDIRWFVIGDGPDFSKLKEYIFKKGLSDHMILMGQRSNPYPYFKSSDLVAVLSYYEGLCGVVNEAKILERPLIATLFSGVQEQIKTGLNGIVVDNNELSILEGMQSLLSNPELLAKIAVNEMPTSITNDDLKIDQFEKLFYS